MSNPCIITVAITGALPTKQDTPAVPVTPSEQIESTHEAFEAGASLVHIHVRNPDQTPSSDPDKYHEVQPRQKGIIEFASTSAVRFGHSQRPPRTQIIA
jgi:3-keto-5-aminohexanoate cleavage enzyme